MARRSLKRAKSFEVFLKYAGAYAKKVRFKEESKLDEQVGPDGKKLLVPQTRIHLVADLPKHDVTLVYDELYVNRGQGFEDADGEIVKPYFIKTRLPTLRTALDEKGLEIEEIRDR
jgi:hypothetical protein